MMQCVFLYCQIMERVTEVMRLLKKSVIVLKNLSYRKCLVKITFNTTTHFTD